MPKGQLKSKYKKSSRNLHEGPEILWSSNSGDK